MNDAGMTTAAVLAEVYDERIRQDAKFPGQTLPDGTGPSGIGPMFHRGLEPPSLARIAEIAREICDAKAATGMLTWADVLREEYHEALAEDGREKLRRELIQVAAVAVRWVEDIDRRCSTCEGARIVPCAAHQAGDGCDQMTLPCPDCAR